MDLVQEDTSVVEDVAGKAEELCVPRDREDSGHDRTQVCNTTQQLHKTFLQTATSSRSVLPLYGELRN